MSKLFEAIDKLDSFILDEELSEADSDWRKYWRRWEPGNSFLNGLSKIDTKNISKENLDKLIFQKLQEVLSDKDKEEIVFYGGYFVEDYNEGEPEYKTSDVVSSSFSEYMEVPISLSIIWNDKKIPLDLLYKEVYNSYNGGWN